MNKKKLLSLALVIALLAIMVGSSLAYFTAQDEVTNTFTVGSVKIEIYENDEHVTEDSKEFGKLVPVVKENPSEDVSYVKKEVEVKNTGANAAYVRTFIAIPTDLVNYLYLDLSTTGWTRQPDQKGTYDGLSYDVFVYDYDAALEPDHFTNELLKGAYLASNVDLQENTDGNLEFILREHTTGQVTGESGFVAHVKGTDGKYTSNKVCILVASQAIQAQGFDNATDALNAGFATNPWAVTTNP